MSLDYGFEQFTAAIQSLSTSSDSIQQRLFAAYGSRAFRVEPEDVPEAFRPKLKEIKEKLNPHSSIQQLSNEEAEQAAKDLFDIFIGIVTSMNSD